MPNPLENKMVLYYLNALGQGLARPDDPMQQVGAVTKQTIAAQNQMNLIKKFLAGGGNLSQKEGKINYTGDISAFLGGDEKSALGTVAPSALTGALPKYQKGTEMEQWMQIESGSQPGTERRQWEEIDAKGEQLRRMLLNPSDSSLDVSGADLVGLTPENISQALQLKFMSEEIERKKISDVYKMMQPAEVKDTRSAKVKTFEYAREQGYKGSFVDFQNVSETTHKKDYDEAVEGGYTGTFNNWMLEMAKAGAINLGEVTKREVAKRKGIGEAEVMAPGYSQSIREDLMKDRANWPSDLFIKQYTDKGLSYIEAEERAQKRMILESMDRQIRQAFKGKKVTLGEDGWEVDGELKVRYP